MLPYFMCLHIISTSMLCLFYVLTYIDPMNMVKDTSERIRKTSPVAWNQTSREAKSWIARQN